MTAGQKIGALRPTPPPPHFSTVPLDKTKIEICILQLLHTQKNTVPVNQGSVPKWEQSKRQEKEGSKGRLQIVSGELSDWK